jgi:hypothetical protein
VAVTQEQGARDGDEDRGRRTCCETLVEASREMRRHDAPGAPSVSARSINVSLRSWGDNSLRIDQNNVSPLSAQHGPLNQAGLLLACY